MKRSDFQTESEILDQDFNELLDNVGGKAAGLLLQNKLLSRQHQIQTLPFVSIPTSVYRRIEEVLEEMYEDPLAYAKDAINISTKGFAPDDVLNEIHREPSILLADKRVSQVLNQAMQQARKEVAEVYWRTYFQSDKPQAILRSSTTVEDFRDDRFWGTFKSFSPRWPDSPFDEFKQGFRGSSQLMQLFSQVFFRKKEPQPGYELEDIAAAAVLMPWIPREVYPWHITAYSGFPEDKESYPILEVQGRDRVLRDEEEMLPLQLHAAGTNTKWGMYCSGNNSSPKEDKKTFIEHLRRVQEELMGWERESLTELDPISIGPHHHELNPIYKFLTVARGALGYEVNVEVLESDIVRHDGFPAHGNKEPLISVQLRPVPQLPETDIDLTKKPEDVFEFDHTHFVYGAYRVTGRLARAWISFGNSYLADKVDFGGPVILEQGGMRKGHRFYGANKQVQSLISFHYGHAVSHNWPILGSAGPQRDNFKFYGAPGLYNRIPDSLFKRQNVTVEGKEIAFGITDFPVTIESDGRRGRMLVNYEALEPLMMAQDELRKALK